MIITCSCFTILWRENKCICINLKPNNYYDNMRTQIFASIFDRNSCVFKFYSASNFVTRRRDGRQIAKSATVYRDRLSLLSRNWNQEGQDLCRSPPQQPPMNQTEPRLNRCSPLIGDRTCYRRSMTYRKSLSRHRILLEKSTFLMHS